MRVIYDDLTGEILARIKDHDWPYYVNSINVPHTIVEIDDTDESKRELRTGIWHKQGKVNDGGEQKYSVDTKTGDIKEKANWSQKEEDISLAGEL